jgi:hypothetical protein
MELKRVKQIMTNTFGAKFTTKRVNLSSNGKVKRRVKIMLYYDLRRPNQVVQYYVSNTKYRSVGSFYFNPDGGKWVEIIRKGPVVVEMFPWEDGMRLNIKYSGAEGSVEVSNY